MPNATQISSISGSLKMAGEGATNVKFTYTVKYEQYGYTGTAKVTVFVDEN